MKKITKILIPAATIAASTMSVMPLVTSCSKTGIEYEDVTNGYTPSIGKHSGGNYTLKEAYQEYAKAFKKDPKILSEDYKYFGSQLIEYFDAYFNDPESKNADKAFNVEKMRVGLGNFSIDDDNNISYSIGIDTKFNLDYEIEDVGKIKLDVNLNLTSDFNKFSGFELQNHSSKYVDNWILVQPVWPADLTKKDWSYTIDLKGSINLKIDDQEAMTIADLDTTTKFDYNNALLLELDIGGATLLDLFQRIGAFRSYYLSDITCEDHVTLNSSFLELYPDGYGEAWNGSITGSLDETDYDADNIVCDFDQNYVNFGYSTIDSSAITIYLSIYDSYLQNYLNDDDDKIRMYINYVNSKSTNKSGGLGFLDTYLWSEKHSMKPRFHLGEYQTYFDYAKYDTEFSFDKWGTSVIKPKTFTLTSKDGQDKRYFEVEEILVTSSSSVTTILPTSKYTVNENTIEFADGVEVYGIQIHYKYKGLLNSDFKGTLTEQQ